VDEADGTLLLTDCQNHRILRLSSKDHGGKESVQVICGTLDFVFFLVLLFF
jgi:hypothetical protein